jgi:CubicO group peptidase (beta-lactamase class C family)
MTRRPSRFRGRSAVVVVLLLASGCTPSVDRPSTGSSVPSAASPASSRAGGASSRASKASSAVVANLPSASRTSSAEITSSPAATAGTIGQRVERYLGGWEFAPKVRAVLVQVNGKMLLQRYSGKAAAQSRSVASVTKSVISTLIGIAIAEHRIKGLDERLDHLLPRFKAVMKSETKAITLRQLLTMTAGLPDTVNSGPDFDFSSDWVRAILRVGPDHPPGETFAYADADPHLLSAILVQATGMSVLEYARAKLFDPLGIDSRPAAQPIALPGSISTYNEAGFAWPVDPQGIQTGWDYLKVTPGDMLQIGRLFLDQGEWNGRQIVPAEWVRNATTGHVLAAGLTLDARYGYLWWVVTADGDPAFAAVGYGGQLIEVVPRRGLVVVVSSDYDLLGDGSATTVNNLALVDMVDKVIAPAVARR